MSLVALAQGVPFYQGADDLLRSKDMDNNAFNSGDYTSVVTSNSGMQFGAATYLQPNVILQGRLVRLGVDVKW